MKIIVKQIFRILVDIILSICWGALVVFNAVCYTTNEHHWAYIVSIVYSSILLIVNIISLFVDIRKLNNLCNTQDEELNKILLFIKKEIENNVQSKKD